MYDARQIANWFIQRAARDGRKLSIMQLLKLVYISHGWHLEITRNPLFRNRIEAWQHGPVIPDVYHAFRPQGIEVVREDARYSAEPAERVAGFLEEIYSIYGRRSPFNLSEITHVPGGPWDIAIRRSGRFAPITDDLIYPHYAALRANRTPAKAS